jgi:hypothetical protein
MPLLLGTNRGRLPLHDLHTDAEDVKKITRELQDCLYVLDEWIYQGREALVAPTCIPSIVVYI